MEDYFSGITTKEVAKKRYRELSKIHHPDNVNGGDGLVMREINIQYDAIKDRGFHIAGAYEEYDLNKDEEDEEYKSKVEIWITNSTPCMLKIKFQHDVGWEDEIAFDSFHRDPSNSKILYKIIPAYDFTYEKDLNKRMQELELKGLYDTLIKHNYDVTIRKKKKL